MQCYKNNFLIFAVQILIVKNDEKKKYTIYPLYAVV